MTKKEITTAIKSLLTKTTRVFFHNELKRIKKDELIDRLETLKSIVEYERLIKEAQATYALSEEKRVLIAVFGPNPDCQIEVQYSQMCRELDYLLDKFG